MLVNRAFHNVQPLNIVVGLILNVPYLVRYAVEGYVVFSIKIDVAANDGV